jgi:N-acylneuraminate cytidylyltransferase/CMP-N,N'-diacetyllegionaminic acid synthase
MKRICTICARGGSKGVLNKNIRPLSGRPLLAHSIEQAKASGLFDRIAVSSDSDEILSVASNAGADAIKRPPALATDGAGKIPAIHHALVTVEGLQKTQYDVLVDLDATSPLRNVDDIAGAVALQQESGATSVITGAPSHRSPYFNLVERAADGSVRVAKPLPAEVERRQDAPATFDMNASIYVWDAAKFRAEPKTFYGDTKLFEMPPERSLDIDSPLDFEIVEFLWQRRQAITR